MSEENKFTAKDGGYASRIKGGQKNPAYNFKAIEAIDAEEAAAQDAIAAAKGNPVEAKKQADDAMAKMMSGASASILENGAPLYTKFDDIMPGVTQVRAKALQAKLPPNGGADLVKAVMLITDQTAQLARELQVRGIPLIGSFDKAVPAFSKTSVRARQLGGLDEQSILPGKIADFQKLT